MKKISGKIVLLLLVLQIANKEANANNNDPVAGKPLVSTVKLLKPVPIKFNSIGKQLEYKRKLAFEGKDSAEAYIKANQKLDPVEYLELTGGTLTGDLTMTNANIIVNNANLYVYGGSSYIMNTITDTYLQSSAASGYISMQGIAFSGGTRAIALNASGGNVGIGTIAPTSLLQVGNGSANTGVYVSGTSSDVIQVGAHLNLGTSTIQQNASGGSTLWTYNSGWKSRMYINGVTGNVGISTTNPSSTLDFGSSATQPNYHYPLLWYNDDSENIWGGTKMGIFLDQFGLNNNNTLVFSTSSSNDGSFIVASKNTTGNDASSLIPRLTVRGESGNMGIGTTTPQAGLDVAKVVGSGATSSILARLSEGSTSGEGSFLGVKTWSAAGGDVKSFSLNHVFYGNTNSAINFFRGGGVTGGFLTFDTNDGSERMRIDVAGNVGIGTTTPNANLDVSGKAQIGRSTETFPSDTYLRFAVGDNGGPAIKLFSDQTATNAMSSGIKLSPYGANKYVGYMISNNGIASNSTTSQDLYVGSGGGGVSFGKWGNDPLSNTSTSFTPTMLLSSSGNLLIGKTSQTNTAYKLDVDGIVRANKIVVNTTGADFVFDSTYHLPSLETVAGFIKANKHLPQIASAEEMQKNGLDVGEQQTKLLQKIEELTLYAIEQDKKIKQQEQLNKDQEKINKQHLERLKLLEEKLNKLLADKK